jgi:hypothetical protein
MRTSGNSQVGKGGLPPLAFNERQGGRKPPFLTCKLVLESFHLDC